MSRKKAVILMTVCRRYHELAKNLPESLEIARHELGYQPDVILVWARPEVPRLWVMQKLMREGLLTHVIGRPELPGECTGAPTTYPESVNIRQGLEYIREHYGEGHYAVMMTADIVVRHGTLATIDAKVNDEGCEAVLFFWGNSCCQADIWHTNFFAVGMDELYWPPVSPPGHADVLERQWGLLLASRQLPGIHRWHNYNSRRFFHSHDSEGLDPFPCCPQSGLAAAPLHTRGYKPWWRRLYEIYAWALRGVFPSRKFPQTGEQRGTACHDL